MGSTYNLSLLQEDAMFDIERSIDAITTAMPWGEFKKASRGLSDNFLILSTASLLADLKLDMFFLNLCRSAENWRRFLISSEQHYTDGVACLHYNTPLLAAIIANDRTILKRLHAAMPKQWQPGEEYQDQYCISWLFLLLSLNNCKLDEDVQAHLNDLKSCEGDPLYMPLFESLLGLNNLDESDFWAQFETLLYQYEEQTEANALKSTISVQEFAAKRFIWFEGLVALRLAKLKNFTMPSSGYVYCPDEALKEMPLSYPGDWVMLSSVFV